MFNTLKNATQPKTQQEALPGQVANSAGGFSFAVDMWTQLERFLILGTSGGTYYINEKDLTKQNLDAVKACLDVDPVRTIQLATKLSEEGRVLKNDTAIFVLALAIAGVKKYNAAMVLAYDALPKICRTFTHLSHLLTFVKQIRDSEGLGRKSGMGYRRAIANWYNNRPVESLMYQTIKYQSRDGFSQTDAYRISHPLSFIKGEALTPARKQLYNYLFYTGEKALTSKDITEPSLSQLKAVLELKEPNTLTPTGISNIIIDKKLPLEAIPTELHSPEVYGAVLPTAGLTWVLRNLGNLAKHGVTTDKQMQNLIIGKLTSEEQLSKDRIHPIEIMRAMLIYSQGHGEKGKSTWTPERKIINALDEGFRKAFRYVEPSGKRILYGIDTSGSMSCGMCSGIPQMSVLQGAAIVAMVSMATEENIYLMGYDTQPHDLATISPNQRIDDVVRAIGRFGGGGTDCSLPFKYAIDKELEVDLFVNFTDSETWAGNRHPKQVLNTYRSKSGINAKAINVAMTANGYSTNDQDDPLVLEVCGFDTTVPSLISTFAKGEV